MFAPLPRFGERISSRHGEIGGEDKEDLFAPLIYSRVVDMSIDAHCHLHDEQFERDREQVIARALERGVKRMLLIGTDIVESKKAIALAQGYEEMWVTVGVHPHTFNQQLTTHDQQQILRELEELLQYPKVVGIGEVGLDYFSHTEEKVTNAQKASQREGFLVQAKLAEKYHLPLVIHTRPSSRQSDDAYLDLSSLLLTTDYNLPAILHSYQGSVSMTEQFLKLPNVYFSFAGYITYPVRKDLVGGIYDIRESIKIISLDRMLTETDSPYLAPQAMRGKRNEPAFVEYVAGEVASIKRQGISKEREKEVKEVSENEEWKEVEWETEKNFEEVFVRSSNTI